MNSIKEIEESIFQAASEIENLPPDLKKDAVSELLGKLQKYPLPPSETSSENNQSYRIEFAVKHKKFGTASVKFTNYFISWKTLLLKGSSIPASYLSSTLTSLTILLFLATGAVHVFDQIDAKVLALIHKNSKKLPIPTGEFYDLISDQVPQEINKALFMQRVVDLSNYGAISIDNDLLEITETLYSFDR